MVRLSIRLNKLPFQWSFQKLATLFSQATEELYWYKSVRKWKQTRLGRDKISECPQPDFPVSDACPAFERSN